MNITTAYQLTEVLRKQADFREDFASLLVNFSRVYLASLAKTDILAKFNDLVYSPQSYSLFPIKHEKNTWQHFLTHHLEFNHLFFEEFREICNQLLDFISYGDKSSNHKFGISTPLNLVRKLVELADLQPNQIIYDPACGYGNIFKEIYSSTHKINTLRNTSYTLIGQDLDFLTCFLAELNLSLNEIEADIIQGEYLLRPPSSYKNKIDIVISHIPFNTRLYRKELDYSSFPSSVKTSNTEYPFIELALDIVHDKGKVVMIVPESFLQNDKDKDLRKSYVENNWLEKIISLPVSIFSNIGTKTSIFILNKGRNSKQQVIFEGYDKELNLTASEVVSNKAIEQNDFSLATIKYLHPLKKEFEQLLQIHKDKKEVVTLGNIAELKMGSSLHKKVLDVKPASEAIPYIDFSFLNQNGTDFRPIQLNSVDKYIIARDVSESKLIDYSAILVGIVGDSIIKTVYFKYENQAIAIGMGIFSIKINDINKISIEYLMMHLHSRFVKIQIEMFSSNYFIKRITLKDFLSLNIILPSLELQQAQVFEFKEQILREKKLELGLQESKEAAKLNEFDIIGIAVHNLGHKLASMKANLTMLQDFIAHKSAQGEVIKPNEPISPIFEEDTPEEIQKLQLDYTLQNVINTLEEAISQIYSTREEIQNNSIYPQKINITKFFREELKPLYESPNFHFIVKGDNIEAEIDKNSFRNLARNLVINAQQHQAKSVLFELSYIKENPEGRNNMKTDKFSILYKNDGLPFPEDFDFEKDFKMLYQKSSYSKGSGIGGYTINKITELHNGTMQNVSPDAHSIDLYKVQIVFILPIHHTPNPIYVKSNSYSLN